jgi:hypothetical protein
MPAHLVAFLKRTSAIAQNVDRPFTVNIFGKQLKQVIRKNHNQFGIPSTIAGACS